MISFSANPGTLHDVRCRQALNKTGIPGFDYCINPYTGCSHGCVYCYATFMKRYSGHLEPWGSFVDAKVNIVDILVKEVWKRKRGRVVVGSVCDAYQPAEAKYRLTRGIVETLVRRKFPFRVLTKSALVTRDIDIFSRAGNCGVSVTITTLDEAAAAVFEPGASSVKDRLAAVGLLVQAGLDVGVFIGPILPWFSDTPERLAELFTELARLKVKHVMVDRMNYLKSKLPVILPVLRKSFPAAVPAYLDAANNSAAYTQNLRQTVTQTARRFPIDVEAVF